MKKEKSPKTGIVRPTDIAQHANGHAVELAGAMGIVYTLSGIFKGPHDQ
ncbi:MAG: hypothetical protein RLZZ123_300 [Pseudomonadota bacterium]|jgi:hypothetical protein